VLLVSITLLCAGCSRTARPDLAAARQFDAFPLYWLGPQFEGWKLASVDGLSGTPTIVSFIYGDCTPTGGSEPSCTPPLEVQISKLCPGLAAVARSPIWRHRQIRGAPVGTIDSAPVLFSRRVQVKVYRGVHSKPRGPLGALHALRSLNAVPPVMSSAGRIPAPARGVLDQPRRCTA
jgi:hypothetical protein